LKNKTILSMVAILIAVAVWGTAFAVGRYTLDYAPPFFLLFIRFFLALLVIYPFAHKEGFRLSMTFKPELFLIGLMGIALSYGLSNVGMLYSTSANAALTFAVGPVITGLLSIYYLRTRPSLQVVLGALISIVGVFFATNIQSNSRAPNVAFGNILFVGAMVVYCFYTVLVKKASDRYSSMVLTAVSFSVGLVFFIPIAAGELAFQGLPHLPFSAVAALVYLGVIGAALAFFFWNYGLRKVDATLASALMNLMPVVGLVASYFLGEDIGWRQIVGGLVVIVGVLLCTLPKPVRKT
jgi:drug/metabolite transporter (DMT)-like permease